MAEHLEVAREMHVELSPVHAKELVERLGGSGETTSEAL